MDELNILFDETPLDDEVGDLRIYVLDGEDCADLVVSAKDDDEEIPLRLDRNELVALITAASKALAALNG